RTRLHEESGQSLIEIMIALIFISVAVAAVLSLMTAGAISLQRSGQKGTALTLADKQLETFRAIGYSYIRLNHNLVPVSGVYTTANSTDSSIPASTPLCTTDGQLSCLVTDGTTGTQPCTATPTCTPSVQTVTGPDGRSYEIDTYITFLKWTSATYSGFSQTGRPLKSVLVV